MVKFIQSSTKKANFDHSLTVTPAVRHGKTEFFAVFERSNDSRDPYNNRGRQANVSFPTIKVSFLWRMK